MPIITKFICDKCGHQQETDDQMWSMKIELRSHERELLPGSSWATATRNALWCRSCVESIGLLPKFDEQRKEVPVKEPTFEDMIRQIVESVLSERSE